MMKNEKITIAPVITVGVSPMDKVQGVIDDFTPDMYLICAEAWSARVGEGETIDSLSEKWAGKMSQHPNRVERITCIAKTKDGRESFSRLYDIVRKDGKIVDFVQFLDDNITMESNKLT